MVLFRFAKQLGRAILRKKASTSFMKLSSSEFNLYRAFSSAPISTLRQFSTFDEGSQDQPSGSSSEPRTPQPAFNNPETDVFVGGLDWSAGENEVKDFFKAYGEVTVRIPKNLDGRSRGFAFVRFATVENAKKALENNGKELLGRTIKVSPAGEKPEIKNNKIFVANISNAVSQEILTQHFSQYGSIKSVKIVNDPEGKPRGFGFVEFENSEDALKSLKSSGMELDGRALVVNISLPKSKLGERSDRFGGRRDSFEGRREDRFEDYGEDRRGGHGRRGGEDYERGDRRGGYARGGDDYEGGRGHGRGGDDYEGGRGGFGNRRGGEKRDY